MQESRKNSISQFSSCRRRSGVRGVFLCLDRTCGLWYGWHSRGEIQSRNQCLPDRPVDRHTFTLASICMFRYVLFGLIKLYSFTTVLTFTSRVSIHDCSVKLPRSSSPSQNVQHKANKAHNLGEDLNVLSCEQQEPSQVMNRSRL